MTRVQLSAAVMLAGLVAATPDARSETAFLCEGGRIVYANDATLERQKREDACVAGYFGLKVEGKAAGEAAGGSSAGDSARASQSEPPIELRPSSAREVTRNPKHSARRRFHEAGEPVHSAANAAPLPLRVINAGAAATGER